jgi:hypothetical protein
MSTLAAASALLLPAMSTTSDTRALLELLATRRVSNDRPVEILHDAATTTRADTSSWCEHSLDRLTRGIDLPAILYRHDIAPDEAVPDTTWYCQLRTYARGSWPVEREWVAIARRVVAAAGLADDGEGRDCPWVLMRDNYDTVHLIASTAAVMEAPREIDQRRVLNECHAVGAALAALQTADPIRPREQQVASISVRPDGVATLAYRGESIADITRDLDWIPGPHYPNHWYRTPFGADTAEVADLARAARAQLSAAGYTVRVDPALGLVRSSQAQGRVARPDAGSRRHTVTPHTSRNNPSAPTFATRRAR